MKRIQSKFLAIAFAVSSMLSMRGMEPWQPAPVGAEPRMAQDNDVQLLGMPLKNPGDVSLCQKRDKDEVEAKAKKDAVTRKSVVIPAQKAIPMPIAKRNGVRSLIDVLPPKFKNIPAAVWQSHLAPCIDHGPSMLPLQLKPMEVEAGQKSNLEWKSYRLQLPGTVVERERGKDIESPDKKFIVEIRSVPEEM
jgi:hypothetical protein